MKSGWLMFTEPDLDAWVQKQIIHIGSRKPTGRICFRFAIGQKWLFHVRQDHVEFPISAAILNGDFTNAIGRHCADLFLEFSPRAYLLLL